MNISLPVTEVSLIAFIYYINILIFCLIHFAYDFYNLLSKITEKHYTKMQKIFQTGLSAGMSATEGVHSLKPTSVDPSFNGLKSLLPQSFVPAAEAA